MTAETALFDPAAATALSPRRVLLTGASGFLGRQLVRQGFAAGIEMHALGRNPVPEGAQLHRADLSDHDIVAGIVLTIAPDAVIHAAAPGVAHGPRDFAAMMAVTGEGTRALYSACAALPHPPAVIQVGSGFEYAPSDEPVNEDWPLEPAPHSYGAAKVAASKVAAEFADRLAIAVVRPFHLYGAGEAAQRLGPFLVREALARRTVRLTGCAQLRDFLHVDDCAAMVWDALMRLAPEPGITCRNLGSGRPVALSDYVDAVSKELARRGFAADCQIGALPYREGEPMVSLPDISRWFADGGRTARIGLAEGIADLVEQELAQCA